MLADEYRVIHYDQRGTGETELGDERKVTFAGAIEDLETLRRGLGIEKLDLIGHSFGGLIALLYAGTHPARVGSLVLYAAAPPFVPEMADLLWKTIAAQDEAEKDKIVGSPEFAQRDPKSLERFFLNQYVAFFDHRSSRDGIDMGFAAITAANVLEASDRMARDLGALDPMGALAKISCPTLVIHCEHDAVPEDFSRLLTDKIPGARYAFLEGINHFAHVEAPAVFGATVKQFLSASAA